MTETAEIVLEMNRFLKEWLEAGNRSDDEVEAMMNEMRRRFPEAINADIVRAARMGGYLTPPPHELAKYDDQAIMELLPKVIDELELIIKLRQDGCILNPSDPAAKH